MYASFIDLEKVYGRVNREALWHLLRMYNGCKRLSGIKSVYFDILACVRLKGGDSLQFRIDIGVRQGCVMFP